MTGANGSNGFGKGESDDGEDPHGPVVGEVPREILELGESCRQFTLTALGFELDYEPETLPVLDEYLRMATAGIADRPQAEPLIARTVAAYFGEVVRRRVDSFWRHREDPNDPWELCAKRALLSLSPLGVVLDAMAKSSEHDGPSGELRLAPDDEELAEERLERLPPVAEEDFYLLSTRLEIIETVYETLRERLKAEGRESLVFEETDYETE